MMCVKLVLVWQVLLLVCVVEQSWSLSCINCRDYKCPEEPQCAGGKVLDVCGCCYECGRLRGEECGGPFDTYGVCEDGLVCVRHGRYLEGVCKDKEDITTTVPPETTTSNAEKAFQEFIKKMKSKKMRKN